MTVKLGKHVKNPDVSTRILFVKFVNPNRPGRFLKFSKNLNENFKKLISPQLRAPEKQTITRLKGLVLGFHFAQVSSCRRAPLSPEF